MKRLVIGVGAVLVVGGLIVGGVLWRTNKAVAPALTSEGPITPTPKLPTPLPAGFNKQQYSLTDPTSLWVVVNKQRPLSPQTYAPVDLTTPLIGGGQVRSAAATALDAMAQAAQQAGVPLKLISGYRSFASQQAVYGGYASRDGSAQADTYSARPGFSEHQTGWAADLGNRSGACDLEQCFGETALGQWLAAHAFEYGFVIRYQQDKTDITGYEYEPWHVRYVGLDLAKELQTSGQTLEEYFELPAAPDYL